MCNHTRKHKGGQCYAHMRKGGSVASLTVIRKSCAAVPRRRRGTVCFASSRCRESTSQTYSLARRPAGSTPKFTMRIALASTRGWALYVVYPRPVSSPSRLVSPTVSRVKGSISWGRPPSHRASSLLFQSTWLVLAVFLKLGREKAPRRSQWEGMVPKTPRCSSFPAFSSAMNCDVWACVVLRVWCVVMVRGGKQEECQRG